MASRVLWPGVARRVLRPEGCCGQKGVAARRVLWPEGCCCGHAYVSLLLARGHVPIEELTIFLLFANIKLRHSRAGQTLYRMLILS